MRKYLGLIVLTSIFASVANGQISSTSETVADAAKKVVVTEEISAFDFFIKGGFFLIPISILLFYTIFVIVERYLFIKRTTKYNSNLVADVFSGIQIDENNKVTSIEKAISLTERDQTAFGSVLKEGVSSFGIVKISELESNMEKVVNIEIGKMEKKLGHLGLIAGIAPTLGFIGTISGVIKIFYSISISEDISIGNISGGLYEKMISSGSGLIVGIIAFAGYHLLNGMIDNFALNIQKSVLEFIKVLQRPNHGNKAK